MDLKENNELYKDAIMDICKKQRLPSMYERLLNAKFNKVSINSKYDVVGIYGSKENVIRFDPVETYNFPGEEFASQKLIICECSNEDKQPNLTYGTIIFTRHNDLNRWTGTFHLFDEEKEINRVEQISEVEVA